MELREKVRKAIEARIWAHGDEDIGGIETAADAVLAIPEIAEALAHRQIATEFRHHSSVSTGKRLGEGDGR